MENYNSCVKWAAHFHVELTDELFLGLQVMNHAVYLKVSAVSLDSRMQICLSSEDGQFSNKWFTVESHHKLGKAAYLCLSIPQEMSKFRETTPQIIVKIEDAYTLRSLSWTELKRVMEQASVQIINSGPLDLAELKRDMIHLMVPKFAFDPMSGRTVIPM